MTPGDETTDAEPSLRPPEPEALRFRRLLARLLVDGIEIEAQLERCPADQACRIRLARTTDVLEQVVARLERSMLPRPGVAGRPETR